MPSFSKNLLPIFAISEWKAPFFDLYPTSLKLLYQTRYVSALSMNILIALWLVRIPVLAFMALGLFWGSFSALIPEIKAALSVGDRDFGLMILGSAFGLVIAMWFAPWVDRRLGPRSMQISTFGITLLAVSPGLVQSPLGFLVLLAILGGVSGLSDVLMNARVSELEARHGRSLMNIAHGMFSLAYAAAAIAAGILRDAGYGPVVPFACVCVVSMGMVPFMRMHSVTVEPEKATQDAPKTAFPWRAVLLCGGLVLVAFAVEATVETWSALHIERTLGGDAVDSSLGPAMLGLTMALGRFGGQAVAERFQDERVIVVATGLTSVGALLAAIAPTAQAGYLGFAILGLGVSVIGPLGLAIAGRQVDQAQRTITISRAAVVGFSGFIIAPVLIGLIAETTSLRVAYGLVAGFSLLTLPLLLLLRKSR